MKPSQISLGTLFWIVTLISALIACSRGALVVAIPLGAIAGVVLANRYRKKRESDPNYVAPSEAQISARQKSQIAIGCLITAAPIGLPLLVLLVYLILLISDLIPKR